MAETTPLGETGIPIRAESMQMVQLLAGFQLSQALYVMAKLGVATVLADGPRPVEELVTATDANPDALRRLLRYLTQFGIFRTAGKDVVQVTPLGLTLAEGQPGSVRDAALYWMETHYGPFGELLHTARTGEPAACRHLGEPFFEWIAADPELAALQNRAMANVAAGLEASMFEGYRLPGDGGTVADIGGSDGSVLVQLLAGDPGRRGIVFDLPEVVQAAGEVLSRAALADRVEIVAGDFFTSVPVADIYVLSFILHDWDNESCARILRSVAGAAAPGARLVLIEMVLPDGDEPHLAKMMDLVMLAMLAGRERTAEEYRALLARSGFTLDRIVGSRSPYSFIEATRD
ncbi:MAG: methyltransferase [Streptosporangiaceae bacterium]